MKIGALIRSKKCHSSEAPLISITYGIPWNTFVLYELVLLATTWIGHINYRNKYVEVLVFQLLLLLYSWLIVQM